MTFIFLIKHPKWDENTYLNDIAIFKLEKDVNLNNKIQLACLPNVNLTSYPTSNNDPLYAVGWGITYLNELFAEEGHFNWV